MTYSGWLTHIRGHPSATGRAQDSESSPAKDRRYTAVPHNQPDFETQCSNLMLTNFVLGVWGTAVPVQFSSARYGFKHKVLRGRKPAGRCGFLIHGETILRIYGGRVQIFRKTAPGDPDQVTGAATLKLRLPSSVAALICTTRSPRSAE